MANIYGASPISDGSNHSPIDTGNRPFIPEQQLQGEHGSLIMDRPIPPYLQNAHRNSFAIIDNPQQNISPDDIKQLASLGAQTLSPENHEKVGHGEAVNNTLASQVLAIMQEALNAQKKIDNTLLTREYEQSITNNPLFALSQVASSALLSQSVSVSSPEVIAEDDSDSRRRPDSPAVGQAKAGEGELVLANSLFSPRAIFSNLSRVITTNSIRSNIASYSAINSSKNIASLRAILAGLETKKSELPGLAGSIGLGPTKLGPAGPGPVGSTPPSKPTEPTEPTTPVYVTTSTATYSSNESLNAEEEAMAANAALNNLSAIRQNRLEGQIESNALINKIVEKKGGIAPIVSRSGTKVPGLASGAIDTNQAAGLELGFSGINASVDVVSLVSALNQALQARLVTAANTLNEVTQSLYKPAINVR